MDATAKVTNSEKGAKIKKVGMQKDRVLFTQKRPFHPGGGRYVGVVPYELELSYEAWEAAAKQAKGE